MISLKQLRYLDAVARHGHMGHAAEVCAVTQPALSMQLKALEEDLGLILFERLPKGLRLTEAGREIAERARAILLSVEDLADCARAHCAGSEGALSGPLRFGVIPTVAPYLLPALLLDWRDRHPALRPLIRESQTATLLGELSDGALDLILIALPIPGALERDLAVKPLFEDKFLLVSPPGAATACAVAAMREHPLLLLEEGHCLRDQTLAVWPVKGENVSRYDAASLSTLVQLAAAGMGVTLIPEMSVLQETAGKLVQLTRFPEPEPQRLIGLAWRKSSPLAATFERIGEEIAALARR